MQAFCSEEQEGLLILTQAISCQVNDLEKIKFYLHRLSLFVYCVTCVIPKLCKTECILLPLMMSPFENLLQRLKMSFQKKYK